MHHRTGGVLAFPVLHLFLLPFATRAADLPHYDIDSLVYLSTDIVIATVSVDAPKRVSITIAEALYGSLQSNERLERLADFAGFYRPMDKGQRMILFLSPYRPIPGVTYSKEQGPPRFSVVYSGAYLIDDYEHIHEFYQESNPGTYAAQGYGPVFRPSVPTKAEDLALPSLQELRARIAASTQYVQSIRPLLDKAAVRDDASALLNLLTARSNAPKKCGIGMKDAIVERATSQLRSLKDPELSLRSYALAPDWRSATFFLAEGVNENTDLDPTRYLIQTVANTNKDLQLRQGAARMLSQLRALHADHEFPARTAGSIGKCCPVSPAWIS